MPRIRCIKPEFFEDDKIASLSYPARLCFIGLWTLADDFGTTDKLPEVIKGHLFPFDNDPELDVEKFLQEMENLGLIIRYGPRKRYIYIKNFHKHQHINRPSKKRSAPPPEDYGVPVSKEYIEFVKRVEGRDVVVKEPSDTTHETLSEYSVSPHGVVHESSVSTHPKEKEMEKERERDLGTRNREREKELEREEEREKGEVHTLGGGEGLRERGREVKPLAPLTGCLSEANASDVCDENPALTETYSEEKQKKNGRAKAYKNGQKSQNIPPCPYEEIAKLYNEKLPELPQVRKLSEQRKAFVRARWREVFTDENIASVFLDGLPKSRDDGIYWFARYFDYVAESDFLMGRVYTKSRDKPWHADFEWLMRPNNFLKVLEGRYHRNKEREASASKALFEDIAEWLREHEGKEGGDAEGTARHVTKLQPL